MNGENVMWYAVAFLFGVLAGVIVCRKYWSKALKLGNQLLSLASNDFDKALAHVRAFPAEVVQTVKKEL